MCSLLRHENHFLSQMMLIGGISGSPEPKAITTFFPESSRVRMLPCINTGFTAFFQEKPCNEPLKLSACCLYLPHTIGCEAFLVRNATNGLLEHLDFMPMTARELPLLSPYARALWKIVREFDIPKYSESALSLATDMINVSEMGPCAHQFSTPLLRFARLAAIGESVIFLLGEDESVVTEETRTLWTHESEQMSVQVVSSARGHLA